MVRNFTSMLGEFKPSTHVIMGYEGLRLIEYLEINGYNYAVCRGDNLIGNTICVKSKEPDGSDLVFLKITWGVMEK